MGDFMNLSQMETFIEVVKLGSLTRAAEKLFLSQPSVTLQIQRLEQEMGCRLIDRKKGHFILTQEGKRYFRYTEYVNQESKNLFADIARMRQGKTGNLNIVSTPTIVEFVLPSLLNEFKSNCSFVNVNIAMFDKARVIEKVSKERDILGFCGSIPENDDIEAIKIGEYNHVFIVYPGHPITLKKEINASEISGEPFILREMPKTDGLKKIGLDMDNYEPRIIMGSTLGVLSAVEARLGIGLIVDLAITKSEAMGQVKVITVKNFKGKSELYFIYRKGGLISTLTQDFLQYILNYSKAHGFSSKK
jgi:DNA-binding transcriptional LysR family regulator